MIDRLNSRDYDRDRSVPGSTPVCDYVSAQCGDRHYRKRTMIACVSGPRLLSIVELNTMTSFA